MPPKKGAPAKKDLQPKKSEIKKEILYDAGTSGETSYRTDSSFFGPQPITLDVSLQLDGGPETSGEWKFITIFNGKIFAEGPWIDGVSMEIQILEINLRDFKFHEILADTPLVLLLRGTGAKGAKDPDPLLNQDNVAGACIDLFPLVLGEEKIFVEVPLVYLTTGKKTPCSVKVYVSSSEPFETDKTKIPLTITMISGHCFPYAKEGTVYLAGIGLDEVCTPVSVKFNMSLSTSEAEKYVWATASQINQGANTSIRITSDDVFVPEGLLLNKQEHCRNIYWNAMKRVLVDPELLRARLSNEIFIELAGVPKIGKTEVRGRFIGYVDAGALLEPAQLSLTTSASLLIYNEQELQNQVPLLDLPVTSAKASARAGPTSNLIVDEYEHRAFVILRFDLVEPLVAKVKMAVLYESIGMVLPEGPVAPIDELEIESVKETFAIDVRRIRKEGGALAVHKELSSLSLACMGTVPMNQGIKRTAANRLLMKVRSMLKQFRPGECSNIEWQDTVTGQHAASRRAVMSSFAPQSPISFPVGSTAVASTSTAGDNGIANSHSTWELEQSREHPKSLIRKTLSCLEEEHDLEAEQYIIKGLHIQPRNRFLLWIFGGQQYNKGHAASKQAAAALRIGVKGDYSDATANAIGWAALHTLHHINGNYYAAFVAAKRMRKSYELRREWKKFRQRWVNVTGEDEIYWIPDVISTDNPFLVAAAFFLCLKCYTFSESLLKCSERGCVNSLISKTGGRSALKLKPNVDIYYLRAATLLQRKRFNQALRITTEGIKKFGPSAAMSEMQATCLICISGWDGECRNAVNEAERAGAELNCLILLKAAAGTFMDSPKEALQWAARAHKKRPTTHSALMIGRIYGRLGNESMAERWAAAAVKLDPLLADGWAVLALLALYERNGNKARTLLRTAKQAGPVSPDIKEEVERAMKMAQIEALPDSLVKDLCYCDYF